MTAYSSAAVESLYRRGSDPSVMHQPITQSERYANILLKEKQICLVFFFLPNKQLLPAAYAFNSIAESGYVLYVVTILYVYIFIDL